MPDILTHLLPEQLANLLEDMVAADCYDAELLRAVTGALVNAVGMESAAAMMAVRGIDLTDLPCPEDF